ncbi:MAG: 4-hydroxy-tetrahydrodipicolinate synthase [Ignavibacteria bacterium GWF2_33_9]|nr:MAG: 4-hydroxy-tetrahydrodipicolinate synthase [Ignavibacteria bacterium GWF2_33_9]
MPKGTLTAIVTPFKSDYSIDFDAYDRLLEYQINNHVDGIVVCGSTGENPTLNQEEKIALILRAIEVSEGRVPIIAGTGSNDTYKTIEFSIIAKETGADALLLVAPYYNKPTQKGMIAHFTAINDAVQIPQIIYNVPGRTGINMTAETQIILANTCKNIVATKEASGDIHQIMKIVKDAPEKFVVLSGDDGITLPLISAGVQGVISVFSNFAPYQMVKLVNFALEGNFDEARKLHYKYLKMIDLCFIESNPVPAKAILKLMGITDDAVRMPLLPISPENLNILRNELLNIGLIK